MGCESAILVAKQCRPLLAGFLTLWGLLMFLVIDCKLNSHKTHMKLLEMGNEAFGAWVLLATYVREHGTYDGKLNYGSTANLMSIMNVNSRFKNLKIISKLVKQGFLIIDLKNFTIQIPKFLKYQRNLILKTSETTGVSGEKGGDQSRYRYTREEESKNKTSLNETFKEESKHSQSKTAGQVKGEIRRDYSRFRGWTEVAVSWAGIVFKSHPAAPVDRVEKQIRLVLDEMPEKFPLLKTRADFFRVANGKILTPWASEKENRAEQEKAAHRQDDTALGAVLGKIIKRGPLKPTE